MRIINENEFDSTIENGLVLVDFFATWCGPCRMVAPVLEDLQAKYEGRVNIVKVDVDASQQLAIRFGVQSIPTLLLFKDGKLVETQIGFAGGPQIEQLFLKYLPSKH